MGFIVKAARLLYTHFQFTDLKKLNPIYRKQYGK
jgi:hypothetical protein